MRRGQAGFTMLEVVVCVAIIAVLAVSLIPLISFGYTQTIVSGKKTTAVYKEAESMESALDGVSNTFTSSADKTIVISFGGTVFSVTGKLYESAVTYDSLGTKATISSFKPN